MKNIYTAVKIFVNTYSGAALGVPLLLQLTGMVCGVLIMLAIATSVNSEFRQYVFSNCEHVKYELN